MSTNLSLGADSVEMGLDPVPRHLEAALVATAHGLEPAHRLVLFYFATCITHRLSRNPLERTLKKHQ